MNDQELEQLLRNAPVPATPSGLSERLEENLERPLESEVRRERRRLALRYLVPAASLAASLAVLAVVLLWPTRIAYSLEKTVEALRNMTSVHIVHKMRHGPRQPLPSSAGGEGWTTWHPANPFATMEIRRKVIDGRELSRMQEARREVIRNGPLGLIINHETGERTFFLDGLMGSAEAFMNPEDWFLALEEEAERNEIRYEMKDEVDSDGNFQVVVRFRSLDASEFTRMWVNAKTFLPVRMQVVSTHFPEFGAEVVMNEFELRDFGVDFDDEIFAIEPTDAELEKFGLDREELRNLPPTTTAIEIGGNPGQRIVGSIIDGKGEREITATLPIVLVEAPEGEMYIDLRTADGESGLFDVRIGGFHSTMGASRAVIFLGEQAHGVSAVPMDVEDVAAFMKRSSQRGW